MEKCAFSTPADYYRGLDLWMVNDKLEDDEIARQVREFRDKGLYSVIFRTYNGLISDYPGPEFKHKVRVAVEAARECGLKITLQAGYMPSAFPALPKEFQLHRIHPIAEDKLTGEETVLARHDGLAFTEKHVPSGINMLDETATDYYIRTAYEEIWQDFSDEFGKTIISVWVDEPRFENRYLTWTPTLEEIFAVRYGYSITENLPALYFDIGDYKKVRYDYYTLLRDIMERCYYTKVRTWCHTHGLTFSGHLMGEERLSMQISQAIAIMPFYKYFDIPGIDMLRADHDWYDKPLRAIEKYNQQFIECSMHIGAVQLLSAAEQAGKQLSLCEMYGVTAPGFVFRDQMHLFDFFAANGINHQCMHALFYSPRGFRKRFYPQTFNVYQPFWENFRSVKDYVARVSHFISMGKCTKDVLVLHPLETAYGLCRGLLNPTDESNRAVLEDYDQRYYRLIMGLYSAQIPFHFGDLASIDEMGSVENGRFVIGKMSYSTVVVSDIEVLTDKALALLCEFAKNGGRLLICHGMPTRVNGRADAAAASLADVPHEYFDNYEFLLRALQKRSGQLYEYRCESDAAQTVINHRTNGDHNYFFIHNGDCRAKKCGALHVKGMHRAFRFDAETGCTAELAVRFENDTTVIPFTNAIGGSVCIFTKKTASLPDTKPASRMQCVTELTPSVKVCDANVLTLELCTYKTADMADFSADELAIERVVERLKREKYEGEITLRFRFFADFAAKGLQLILEDPEECRVTINGVPVSLDTTGWYYSKAYRTAPLPDAVVAGENIIELTRYTKPQIAAPINDTMTHLFELFRAPVGVDLERIHLLGDFSVEAVPEFPTGAGIVRMGRHFFLTPSKSVSIGDLTSHGYPFYPGCAEYTATVSASEDMLAAADIRLLLEDYNGCSAAVLVNGKKIGTIDREPYTLSLAGSLKTGDNEIRVRLYGTFRNMIGPSHIEGLDVQGCHRGTWYESFDFTDCTEYDRGKLTNSFQLTPYGIGCMCLVTESKR